MTAPNPDSACCDGSCRDALGNEAVCDVCLAEMCECGHMMGQHEFGHDDVPCHECWSCRFFHPVLIDGSGRPESDD